jgi:signal transduction histidine kinase/ActR/RegA family two-component response regulator
MGVSAMRAALPWTDEPEHGQPVAKRGAAHSSLIARRASVSASNIPTDRVGNVILGNDLEAPTPETQGSEVLHPEPIVEPMRMDQQRLDDFLATLGHELRNPLAAIASAVQVLERLEPQHGEAREMHEIIERQSQQMSHLIDDLLDVSRIAHGKLQLRSERLDLVHLIRRTCADFRRTAAASGITLVVKLPPGRLWLDADPTRITQVLINLLQNAVKFTDRAGTIYVTLRRHFNHLDGILTVRDTGIGMEQFALAHVFEPYSQSQRSVQRSRAGLGLGLSIVKGLVEMHGGEISASSLGLGFGSQFSVSLPLAENSLIDMDPLLDGRLAESLYKILIIDDRRDAVHAMSSLLTQMGHQVKVAGDGVSGIAAAGEFRPQIVLCDIGLPGACDGYAVAAALRAQEHTRYAFLVAVTGYVEDEARRRAIAAGFDRHLAKPIGVQDLKLLFASLPAEHAARIALAPVARPRIIVATSSPFLSHAPPALASPGFEIDH